MNYNICNGSFYLAEDFHDFCYYIYSSQLTTAFLKNRTSAYEPCVETSVPKLLDSSHAFQSLNLECTTSISLPDVSIES